MSDRWIVIPGWEKFQHYSDREPIWIRHYVDQLDRDEYCSLSAGARSLLHDLRLLYARRRNQVPASPSWLSNMTGLRVRLGHIEELNHAGFIEVSATKPPKRAVTTSRAPEEEKRREEKNPPTPLTKGGDDASPRNGAPRKLTKRDLARYTGCKITRGTHGFGYKHTPLGQDPPPKDWPHPAPSKPEVEKALNAAADFIAGVTE